ncbi:MAG TPA: RNA polymerase sigma-G factor [Clostridiales bacterium]|nr:RNA polymerase sigma-G factor [Clostridiales bacterium]HBP52578.1 RNA polymerase sigma-G factor [Clostridiales bacterium]HBW05898.1 RNA polymerase sigma-G factor [Clostridiales bacterium]
MLDHQTTLELLKNAQAGDDGAKEKLIEENIPLIKSIVKRFKGRLEYDDLMQLGAMGFVKAMQNFDVEYGVRFSTYAVPMISGEIKRFLRDDGAIKVSRWTKTLAQKITAYIDEKLKNGESEPTVEQLAKAFDVEAQEIVYAMDAQHYLLSLSATVGDDDLELGDKIATDECEDENIDKLLLKDLIADLPQREKKVIILRYFRDKTQSEIAQELGVSQVQVSRIENKVLQKLKDGMID